MGSMQEEVKVNKTTDVIAEALEENGAFEEEGEEEEEEEVPLSGENWTYGSGEGSWQSRSESVGDRMKYLHNCRIMSDLGILACDENWWFGETVKDFTAHKFPVAAASPVLHYVLYELDETTNPDKRLILDEKLKVTLQLVQCYDYVRLEMDGIPPIACEALLDYMYNDRFNEADYENGYSRNLLWRLWHASKAFEMDHLTAKCTKTLHATMCEDTVFWDLNYAMEYKDLGTGEVMSKVLKIVDDCGQHIYENPNFVWLDKSAVEEVLKRRKPGSCDPMIVFNNLLRWTLYQLDRTACSEIDEKHGSEIPIEHRLEWISGVREGKHEQLNPQDVDKYLGRGVGHMPWMELSQKDWLNYVVPYKILSEEELLKHSLYIMDVVVKNPVRLHNSSFQRDVENVLEKNTGSSRINSPTTPRRNLSRTNSLRKSITEVKLREIRNGSTRASSRPRSMIAAP